MTPETPRLIPLPSFHDPRGVLSVVEFARCLPFEPKRFFFIHDVTPGARRAGHAHWVEEEVILALRGSFTVVVDDGGTRVEHCLDRSDVALHIPACAWHELHDFSPGAICAVFASTPYDDQDCCRDYEQFLAARRARPQ